MMRLQQQKDIFVRSHAHAQALQTLMSETDAAYPSGIKSGSKYLVPTFNALFEIATIRYNKQNYAQLDTQAVYTPYTLESDVSQLAQLPVQRKGKAGNISPSNEVINWQAGGSLTLSMDYARRLLSLTIDLGTTENIGSRFKLEISPDGNEWQTVELQSAARNTQLKAAVADMKIRKIKLTNISGDEQKVYFKAFRLREK